LLTSVLELISQPSPGKPLQFLVGATQTVTS